MMTVGETTESIWSKAKAKLALDPSTGLENQRLFWLAVLAPLSLALALAIPVWLDYSLSFSAKGYSTFLKISALPIGISSLSIPLGVLIGRLHGTKQTALQISEAQATNRANLYLAHYSHFKDHFGERSDYKINLSNQASISFHSKLLYESIYPSNSLESGVKEVNPEPLIDVWYALANICQYVSMLTDEVISSDATANSIRTGAKSMDIEVKEYLSTAGLTLSHNFSLSLFEFNDIELMLDNALQETRKATGFDPGLKSALESESLYQAEKSIHDFKKTLTTNQYKAREVEKSLCNLSKSSNT